MRGIVDGEYQDGEIRGLVFLCGRRGMGKTTEMDRLLSTCSGGVIFFDTLSKHADVLKGYKVIAQPGDLEDYLRVNRGRRYRVLYQPRAGELDLHFRMVCTIVRAFGWMIFGIDELDKLCGSRWADTRMPPEFAHLVNYGRHERVSMIATARRPQNVARGYVGESELRIFHLKDQAAIDYIEDVIGADDAERIRGLKQFEFLACRDDVGAELRGGQRHI